MNVFEIKEPVVDVNWLRSHLNHPDLVVLDASWFMPGVERNGETEWLSERIPTALYFDFDAVICDTNSDLPHMLPSVEYFSQQVGLLGIRNENKIVVYDSHGIFSAPRVWWMFKAMGHKDVAVLNGGLPAWKAALGSLESTPPVALPKSHYIAQYCPEWVTDIEALYSKIHVSGISIIDARGTERFHGQQVEPRQNVRRGHIPSSRNLPCLELLDKGCLKSNEDLKANFDKVCRESQSLIFTCGSGVTACILALAAKKIGRENISVYDGSWTEWGSRGEFPIE